ncbi:MAG: DNA-binding response regulator [Bdellovibrionaceae bacterium]|nr:DNA-binding response regulator [Pseudobdellovibrionaceae bacterium]
MMLFKHILIVEDEFHLGEALTVSLRKLADYVEKVSTIESARYYLETHWDSLPDLVVLDRNLPDGDGIQFCRELRNHGNTGMILMLTAQSGIEQRIEGLDAGADDYLPKPFSWEELKARLKALARRLPEKKASIDPLWSMDFKKLQIKGPAGWVRLTPLEFKLAAALIHANGEIVGRDQLLREVWGFQLLPQTRTVDLFMSKLRKRFEPDPERPLYFKTIRGAGYSFQKSA